jgi:hypothetical protein
MMRLHHRSNVLINKEPMPITISDAKQRQRAHVGSQGTIRAKKLVKQLTVKARRWK